MNYNFTPKIGFLTLKYRNDFLNSIGKSIDSKIDLIASDNKEKPLYFWQLYSILGYDNILLIVKTFYGHIFNEQDIKKKWFKSKFEESGPINYHIKGQLKFWLDLMGGGSYYEKEKKLNLYHNLVKEIMTKEGANMWLYYMNITLTELSKNNNFNIDERIIPCINDYINFFMGKYSKEFSFNFKSNL